MKSKFRYEKTLTILQLISGSIINTVKPSIQIEIEIQSIIHLDNVMLTYISKSNILRTAMVQSLGLTFTISFFGLS